MSTTHLAPAVRTSHTHEITPVEITESELESTAPESLRNLKATLAQEGYQPTTLHVSACFSEDCSLKTQHEIERLRNSVRTAAFLGVSTLQIEIDDVESVEKTGDALSALSERAYREGVSLNLSGKGAEHITLETTV